MNVVRVLRVGERASGVVLESSSWSLRPHTGIWPSDVGILQDIWILVSDPIHEGKLHELTQRSMLERQNDDILHTFKRRSAVWAGEALGDDDPDSTVRVPSIPIALLQDVTVEGRKAESVLVAISIDMRAEICEETSV